MAVTVKPHYMDRNREGWKWKVGLTGDKFKL